MNISLARLSEKPKHTVAFGMILATGAVILTVIHPSIRHAIPEWLTNASDLASTILAGLAVLYVLVGVQSQRALSAGDSFDKPKETTRGGIGCIIAAMFLFGLGLYADVVHLPEWLGDSLGNFSMGAFFFGALYVIAGLVARFR